MKKYYLFLNHNMFYDNQEAFEERAAFNWFTLDLLMYHNDFKKFRQEFTQIEINDVITGATFTLYDYDHLYDMHIEPSHFQGGLEYHLVLDRKELDELKLFAKAESVINERKHF